MRSCVQVTMAMDAKDLRTESALSERNNDGSKYSQSGGIALQCDRNKPYQDIGSNSLGKVDVQSARPCAVIGPDRVVPPPASNEAYLKKGPTEPWPCMDNTYHTRRPPEYPHKFANFQNPTRNISPRQTYQENMQRIMVPPSYNSVKISDDTNYAQMSERSNNLPKNIKLNVPPEAKFCEVPYTVYPPSTEQKNVRNPDMCLPSVNPTHTRTAPHGWPTGSVNIRPTRAYGAPELYQYQDYSSCAGPRPVVPRPNRTAPEEPSYIYADPYYHQEGHVRFKPYPTVKERFPQQRYDYISNYANSFHPPPAFPSHKYDLQKTVQPHPYAPYPPIKYLDRVPEPVMEGYQRNQQGTYNIPYCNQMIHPNFGTVLANGPQSKIHSYPPDGHIKNIPPNKLPYDNAKAYIEYENGRPKMYPPSESYLINEMGRMHPMKSQVIMPNYPTINMHNVPPNTYYKKDSQQMKNYEYLQAHFRSMDPNINMHNPMIRHPSVFSPNTLAISPTDSTNSNDTSQTVGTSQEDCGYVSQSSNASVRSMDSGINRIPNDCIRKYYDSRFGPILRTSSMMSKSELNSNHNSKEKKNIDVRQFLQMWNEGDEETEENIPKEIVIQAGPKSGNSFSKSHDAISQQNQEQLYVLGLVNVPSEELGKYEHIQKVSKLPENIKGYNHLELLNQFEEAIESSNRPNYKVSTPKDFKMPPKGVPPRQATGVVPPRPLSPLDVESKISQSVIHKEVGCNFEIKPCSPKMMNVEVATPAQNILAERAIEKVANPVMLNSPRLNSIDENMDCNIMKRKDHRLNINNEPVRIPSCKMINTQFADSNGIDSIKNSYSLQDLESNSGLCLASLPRLDNDIELNFPEVNQQFINANKRDSTSSLRDLPSLEELDQSDNHSKDKPYDVNLLTRENDIVKSPCIIDSEKEFSKLSKYRKSKAPLPDSKDNLNAVRTDSVIIKNPENSKKYEDHSIFSPNCLNKQICDIQQTPMNLTSQGNITENTNNISNITDKESNSSIDIAIDFSLNKNTSNDNTECLSLKNDHVTDILTNSTTDISISTLDKQLTPLPTFSDCDQNTQHYIDHEKLDENIISSPLLKESEDISQNTLTNTNNDENINSTDQRSPEQLFTKTEQLSSAPNGNEMNNEDEYNMSPVASVKEINDINTNSLLPVNFVTPPTEHSPTDSGSDKYLMNFNKNNCITTTNLGKINSTLTEDEMGDKESQYVQDNFDNNRNCKIDDDMTHFEKYKSENDACCEVVNECIESETAMVATQDSELNHAANSPVISPEISENVDCNNLELKVPEIFNTTSYHQSDIITQKNDSPSKDNSHSETMERVTDSQIGLPSSNDIVVNSRSDTLFDGAERDIDSNFDVSFPNNISTHDDCPLDTDDRENYTDFNISSNNMVTNSINSDLLNDTTTQGEVYSSCNIHSPINIAHTQNMPADTKEESDFNKSKPNNIDMCSPDNDLPYTAERLTVSPTNVYQPQTTQKDTDLPSNKIGTHKRVVEKNDTFDSFEDSETDKSEERKDDIKDMEDNYSKDILLQNDVEMSVVNPYSVKSGAEELNRVHQRIKCLTYGSKERNDDIKIDDDDEETSIITPYSVKSVREELNLVHRRLRYLNYGSKEMYSPWIQKLIMFRDGYISTVKTNTDNENNSNNTLLEMQDTCSVDNCITNDCKMHQEINIPDDCMTDILSPNDASEVENDSKIDVNNTDFLTKIIRPNNVSEIENDSNIEVNTTDDYMTKIISSNDVSEIENDSKIDVNNMDDSMTKILSPNDVSETENDSKIDVNNINDNGCVTKDENIIVSNKHDINTQESNSSVECIDNAENMNKDINVSLRSSILNVTDNFKNHFDTFDTLSHHERDLSYSPQKINKQWDEQSICDDEIPGQFDEQSRCNDAIAEQWEEGSDCNAEILEQWDRQSNFKDEVLGQWDNNSDSNDDISMDCHRQSDDAVPGTLDRETNCDDKLLEQPDVPSNYNDSETEPSVTADNKETSCTKVQTSELNFLNKSCQPLKRSLSDSALNAYKNNQQTQENEKSVQFIWPFKRRKMNNIDNDMLAQNLCNIIQSNRRNSISSIYNEENVSFCILIDNSCIISEEENEDQDKICYTELSEECLTEIQNDCIKDDESIEAMTDIISTPQETNNCEYSDSYVMHDEDEKVEESWVEDVACIETVISDDIAEDIEISGSPSPKDDLLSDNDESGVFSSSEHTDKVKYIYGDKMCNDDAHFVETLYNTPQMDVNKTLVQRETLISGEYYDNDSLEKILSESNDREPPYVSPYLPDYTEPVFSPRIVNVKETIDNKENMDVESISPLENNALDIVDTGIDKSKHENVTIGKLLKKTQDGTVHSCESSVDNVFTYKDNDENTSYTSSSPEVSSTTSEEKNSSILLKITNYKGSRISQVNDISRDITRPSCKFTEDKDYVQSHSNFPTHRPLLTKAAQKYIPPLKESMRDLKVKLSLPQHSLIKLKQLKNSKDVPKVCKQNIPVPRISKKPKPKFEDVLKSIDEIHFKMHKEKTKKSKKSIPKVVIKKNENGSHYASTSNKDEFNPDLTGRKWQPWVFIEKNLFIDKMAIKNKTKAVYSHRKRTYVLAEKFYKYRSVNSAKFVISPPVSDCPPTGLKYTIRLKHNY